MAFWIAFDGGATRTRAGLYDEYGHLLDEATGPASHALHLGAAGCAEQLAEIATPWVDKHGAPEAVAAGVAGCATPHVRDAVARELVARLDAEVVFVSDDIRPTLYASARNRAAVAAISGTGSSVVGKTADGRSALVGARGAVFGDPGGAYGVAETALRRAALSVDGLAEGGRLADDLIRATGVTDFSEMPAWGVAASKGQIADLARVVADAADAGDRVARDILRDQARQLADQTAVAIERVVEGAPPRVYYLGGFIEQVAAFREAFVQSVVERAPGCLPEPPGCRGHQAMFEVIRGGRFPDGFPGSRFEREAASPALPPTEQRLAVGRTLDARDAAGIVALMNEEDAKLAGIVRAEASRIARVVEWAAASLSGDGRLIYAGAGTSGRLGVLDASECPPTFGVDPSRVVGLIAGGDYALRHSVEGAEDDADQGARDLQALDPPLGPDDTLVGIAASGTTPYVLGGLAHARSVGARAALLCCNPACRRDPRLADALVIALATGPEALTGSTRLKAGTATKMALNMVSTGALTLAGYVYQGLMVEVRPVNAKLRLRAIRITAALTDLDEPAAERFLDQADGHIPVAVLMAKRGLDAQQARRLLADCGGTLRTALGGGTGPASKEQV